MNDAVLVPVVLVATAILTSGGLSLTEWGKLGFSMLVLSPGIGVAVAAAATFALETVRRRAGIHRDYESIYSLGVAFAAFAGAEAFHGSGFLAAFAAGLTISWMDVELCDCFLEYGSTTAEMALLFTFVMFGASVVWTGLTVLTGTTLLFAALVFVARPVAFIPALIPARTSWRSRSLIAWFGPRGLSSLLLVLLPVFAGVPQTEQLASLCSLVVLCSILVHGLSPTFLLRPEKNASLPRAPVVSVVPAAANDGVTPQDPEFITIAEYQTLKERGAHIVLADVRTERTLSDTTAVGSFRIDPERTIYDARAKALPQGAIIAAYCW
jgi:sodium/hydrogen antiporter